MVTKAQKKEMREVAQEEEEISNNSEASFDRDIENNRNYASDDMPTDMYRYKRMRLVPDSQAEYKGLLDKDVVLGNVQNKKPDPEYLRIMAETIVAFEENFKIKKTVYRLNSNGNKIPVLSQNGNIIGYETEDIMVFDEVLRIIPDFLTASFKADLTLSRAMGSDREAVLDRTQNFGKEIKKSDNSNKYGGGK